MARQGRASQERREKSDEADDGHLIQLLFKDLRLEFGAGQEGEEHRTGTRKEAQPLRIGSRQVELAEVGRDGGGGHPHADLHKCHGYSQVIGDNGRNNGQSQPECGDGVNVFHDGILPFSKGPVMAQP